MLCVLLDTFGHEMTLSDLEDWRMDAAKSLPFVPADCCDALPIPNDASTSLSALINAFEHFPNPRRAMDELLRTWDLRFGVNAERTRNSEPVETRAVQMPLDATGRGDNFMQLR
jgi:hypothetical protein